MKYFAVLFFIIFQASFALSQDGSDMWYVKPEKLDKSYIGRFHHIDFYRESFGGFKLDEVTLKINGKDIEFIEHREDDGFNNWFIDQHLESVNKFNDIKLIIDKFKLLEISEKDILVLAYFNMKPFTEKMSFERKDIAQLLFKDK